MSVIGNGTIISKDNLDMFYKSLIIELNKCNDIYKNNNTFTSSKTGIFIFINENICFGEARLIAIDKDNKNKHIFVYYYDGIIGFAESIQTIKEIEFIPFDMDVNANIFITDKESFVYGCNNNIMYEVIKEKYRKYESEPVKNLMMSSITTKFLLKNKIYELDMIKKFSEKDLVKMRGFSKNVIDEIKDKLNELGLSLREE